MIPQQTVLTLKANITGNVTNQELLQADNGRTFGSPAIEAGGRIILETATTVRVLITDANGVVLHSAGTAVTANKDISPIPRGVQGPLYVTTTDISSPTHTLTVIFYVKK